jgi:hypothetical protein
MKSIFKAALLLLATVMIGAGSLSAQATTATVRGTVVDEYGEPVIGASVSFPALSMGAHTNEEGIFSIPKLPVGEYEIRVTYIGKDTTKQVLRLEKGKTLSIALKLQESSTQVGTITIEDQVVGKINKQEFDIGVTRISTRQINLMPSLGAPDLAQYLQVLPGVISTGDQGGQLYVRGGTPIMNMTYLDGMIVYSPFHSIGLFSIFDTDYIRSVDVYSAAYPAQYGGRVSSIMDIKTKVPDLHKVRGKANINPITTGINLEVPLSAKNSEDSPGGTSLLLSARRSYIDKSSPLLYPYIKNELSDSVDGLPYNFTDIYSKIHFSDGLNTVNFFGFLNTDNVNYEFPANIGWNQWGAGGQFRLLPNGSNVIFSGNFAYSSFKSGLQSASEAFPRESGISGFNGGLRFQYLLNTVDELNFGLTFLGFGTDYRFTNSFGLITELSTNNTEAAFDLTYKKVFLRNTHAPIDSLKEVVVFEPGVHLHYYNDHQRVSPEPRMRLKINLPRFSFTAGAGLFSQNLISANSDRDVVNLFSGYLSAPEYVPNTIKSHTLQTAAHILLGGEFEIMDHLSTRVEGWYKDFTQLTNTNRDKIFPTDPDFIYERGKAQGLDFILRYEDADWYLYGSYGLSKVTRDDGKRVYAPVFDRRHNVNIVGSYSNGNLYNEDDLVDGRPLFTERKWEFGLRFNLGSGFPFTQTQGFFEKIDFTQNGSQSNYVNQNGSLGILYADEVNGGRLPYYHRLDISAKRRWQFGNRYLLEANLTLINLYNRLNVFYFDRVRFAVIHQLPILPSTGITLKF